MGALTSRRPWAEVGEREHVSKDHHCTAMEEMGYYEMIWLDERSGEWRMTWDGWYDISIRYCPFCGERLAEEEDA